MKIPADNIDSLLASLVGQTLGQAAAAAVSAGFFIATAKLLPPNEPFRLDRIALALDENGLVASAAIR